jgi:hypothetical protein
LISSTPGEPTDQAADTRRTWRNSCSRYITISSVAAASCHSLTCDPEPCSTDVTNSSSSKPPTAPVRYVLLGGQSQHARSVGAAQVVDVQAQRLAVDRLLSLGTTRSPGCTPKNS